MSDLGLLLETMGKPADAEPLYRRAFQGKEAKLGAKHPDTIISRNELVQLLEAMGKLADAAEIKKQRQRKLPIARQL